MNTTIAVITGNGKQAPYYTSVFAQLPGIAFFEQPEQVGGEFAMVVDMDFNGSAERIAALKKFLPQPVAVNSVLYTVAEIQQPFIRFNGWPGMLQQKTVETYFGAEQENGATQLFSALGWKCLPMPDIHGLASARVVSMIVNEAYFAFEEGVSSKAEIDTAMKLGTNYPFGPFEWATKIGISDIYALLKKLAETDKRYTPSALLEKEARENYA